LKKASARSEKMRVRKCGRSYRPYKLVQVFSKTVITELEGESFTGWTLSKRMSSRKDRARISSNSSIDPSTKSPSLNLSALPKLLLLLGSENRCQLEVLT
jgi:hypothetical protein